MVDKHAARGHSLQRAARTEGHGPNIDVVADAAEDELGAGRRFDRRRGALAAVLADPLLRPRGGAIEHRDPVTGASQVAGHRIAHDSESDKRYVRHEAPP